MLNKSVQLLCCFDDINLVESFIHESFNEYSRTELFLLREKISDKYSSYDPKNNYGVVISVAVIEGHEYNVSTIKNNLKLALHLIDQFLNDNRNQPIKGAENEKLLSDYVNDEEICKRFGYTASTLSTYRSRNNFPRPNAHGLTKISDIEDYMENKNKPKVEPKQSKKRY